MYPHSLSSPADPGWGVDTGTTGVEAAAVLTAAAAAVAAAATPPRNRTPIIVKVIIQF